MARIHTTPRKAGDKAEFHRLMARIDTETGAIEDRSAERRAALRAAHDQTNATMVDDEVRVYLLCG